MAGRRRQDKKTDFYRPAVGAAEKAAVNEVLGRGWLTSGPVAEQLEKEFCSYLGVKHAIAVSSGTAAIHLGLLAAGVSRGDEVITSPYTFVATAEAIAYCGAKPVFVDVEPGGYTIDPELIENKLTRRTRAILPVGVGGLPCRSDRIKSIARKHKLFVIEDGAHSLGAAYKNKPIGRWADATAFSFYSTKNLTTGEGGMVVTDRAAWAGEMRILSRHGISRATWDRYGNRSWMYDIVRQGYKYNISDLLAAIGRVQLRRFGRLQQMRRHVARWYHELAADIPGISFPGPPPLGQSAFHLMMVRLSDPQYAKKRDRILVEATGQGVGVSVHFIPLHLMTYYRRTYGYRPGDFPQAEASYQATMSLPFYPEMKKREVRHIVDVLRTALKKFE